MGRRERGLVLGVLVITPMAQVRLPVWKCQPEKGQEDALGKEMAAHSSVLAWRVPMTEEPGWL